MHTEIWDSTGIRFDCDTGLPVTGRWRALGVQDLRPAAHGLAMSISHFGSGLFNIPTGTHGWSIGVLSGSVYVNGVGPIPVNSSLNGGNHGSNVTLSTPIQISGAVGAYGLVMWEV